MRKILLSVFVLSFLYSCKKQEYVSNSDSNEDYIDTLTLGREIDQEFKQNPPQKFVETQNNYSNDSDEAIRRMREATKSANDYSKAQIKQGEDAMRQISESHRKMNSDYEYYKLSNSTPVYIETNTYSPPPTYETTNLNHVRYQVQSDIDAKIKSNSYSNSNDVRVNGYTKSDGTYVETHMRTAPNQTTYDNYSTSPNVNPYTGKVGTK